MTVCLSITFFNKSRGATSYLWDFGDGSTSPIANPEHTYAAGGAYVVTLTALGPAGQSSSSRVVTVIGSINDILLSTASSDQLATSSGDFLAVPTGT